jgi:hypothetical protein
VGGSGFSWRRIHKPYALELLLSVYYGGMSAACYLVQNWMLGGYCTGDIEFNKYYVHAHLINCC